ncbi:MAG: metallophosphoesterase family protein, partial [Paludibacteraceae bacterium]|nr:metallophosphoesterase family protein [Paludibacteraceae bacterium]
WMCEGVDVWMTHIGGYPGKYAREVKPEIFMHPPKLFISGHSHILKVMYDKKLGTLHINPGAEGKYGFHNVRTLVRFEIDGTDIRNLEVIEIGMHRQKM